MGKLNRREIPLCACGCLKHVTWSKMYGRWNKFINGHNSSWRKGFKVIQTPWNKNLTKETDPRVAQMADKVRGKKRPSITGEKNSRFIPKPPAKLCECGCLEYARPGRRFIKGHRLRKYPKVTICLLCECGCLQYAKLGNRFINGHQRRGKSASEETIKKQSDAKIGKPSPRKGCHLSEEEKENLRIKNTGKKLPQETKSKIGNFFRDRPLTKEHIEKVRNANIGRKDSEERIEKNRQGQIQFHINHPEAILKQSGPNCPWYIDGRSCEDWPYSINFNDRLKEFIRDRDGRMCQICLIFEEETGKKLDVHHIDYDKKNSDYDNLVALCHPCHTKTNTKRDTWINYFL